MFELRNMGNATKKVELIPQTPTSGADSFLVQGAVFQQDGWSGHCLSTGRLRDTVYFNFFPYWNNTDHFFDFEINGELFDCSNLEDPEYTRDFTGDPARLLEYLRISSSSAGWERLHLRNVTNETLHIKMIKRNDWRTTYWEEETVNIKRICDDGLNNSVIYHPNGDIEFTLAPMVPFDQVPEEDKMILELEFKTDGGYIENIYFEIINNSNYHPSDYAYIDWGDGTFTHHRFAEFENSTDRDLATDYLFIYKEMPDGRRTIKVHTSHPAEFFMVQNVVEIKQFGNYVCEEMYDPDSRDGGDGTNLFRKLPDSKVPVSIAWLELESGFHPDMRLNPRYLDSPFTATSIVDDPALRYWNGYVNVNNFIDYKNYAGIVNNASIAWGQYPEEYPFGGFGDADQLAIRFSSGRGQGVGLRVFMEIVNLDPGLLLSPHRVDNTSVFLKHTYLPEEDAVIFLIDLAKYKSDGFQLQDLNIHVRACYDQILGSGRVNVEMIGWMGSNVDLTNSGLTNVPATPSFTCSGHVQTRRLATTPQATGPKVMVIHWDPVVNAVAPKPFTLVMPDDYPIIQEEDSLDVAVIRGEPGTLITLTAGLGQDSVNHQEFNYIIGDNEEVEHLIEFSETDDYYINGQRIQRPGNYIANPGYYIAARTLNTQYRKPGMIIYYTINDVRATEDSPYEDNNKGVNIFESAMVNNGIIKSRIKFTSRRTGRTYDVRGVESWRRCIKVREEDILRLIIPGNQPTGYGYWLFAVNLKKYSMSISNVTNPQYKSDMLSSYLDNGTDRFYAIWGYGGPTAGTSDDQTIDVVLYDDENKVIPQAELRLQLKKYGGRITQIGNMFNGLSVTPDHYIENSQLSAFPAVLPKNITSLEQLAMNCLGLNQGTKSAIAGWDISHVTNLRYAFYNSNFNEIIKHWVPMNVTNMDYMIASSGFWQDLSPWCVPKIPTAPQGFADAAWNWLPEYAPVWGTCPRGENLI